jgi:hypothetical protein
MVTIYILLFSFGPLYRSDTGIRAYPWTERRLICSSSQPYIRRFAIASVIDVVYLGIITHTGVTFYVVPSTQPCIEGIGLSRVEASYAYRPPAGHPDGNARNLSIYGIAGDLAFIELLLHVGGFLHEGDEEEQGHHYCYYYEDLFLSLAGKAQAFRLPSSGALRPSARTCLFGTRSSGAGSFRTWPSGTGFSGGGSSCACSLGTRHVRLLREFSLLYIKATTGCQTIRQV